MKVAAGLKVRSALNAHASHDTAISALFKRPGSSLRTGRVSLRSVASASPSEIKNKNSPSVVTIKGYDRIQLPVRASMEQGLDVKSYFRAFPAFLPLLEFPMNTSIVKVDEDVFDITVPRMQFSEVWLQPTSTTTCRVLDGSVLEFFSDSAVLQGSDQVEALGLSDRYSLNVRVHITPEAFGVQSAVDVAVNVDLPPPFSLVPKSMMEPTASGVLQTMSSLFLETYGHTIRAVGLGNTESVHGDVDFGLSKVEHGRCVQRESTEDC